MYLSQKQIEDYQTFGVIIIKDVFSEWIEPLRRGFKINKHNKVLCI